MATSDSIEKETTFAKGPWHVGTPHPQNECAYVIGANGDEIAVLYGADQAEQNADGMWGPQPRREATAALIAAAPELYEALQSCVTQMRVWVAINGDLIGALQQNIDAAESALAKARGEDRSHEGK